MQDFTSLIKRIIDDLRALEKVINDSINRTEETDYSYPSASKVYNSIFGQLKSISKDNPELVELLNNYDEVEEGNFLPSGNYQYASDLLTKVRLLHSMLMQLIRNKKSENTIQNNPNITIFISYASEELALADFIEKIFNRWNKNKVEIFIAKRDILSGDDWLEVVENRLKTAQAIIPICSVKAKIAPWVWWETAAVWGASHKVYPLFTNISADNFGAPLTLFTQGKHYFSKEDFIETLKTICKQLKIDISSEEFTELELDEYEKLCKEYIKEETSAKVTISFDKISMTQELHKYSLIFEVENRTKKEFSDIVLELYLPGGYLEREKWEYPHLTSSVPREKPGYICLTFMFSGLGQVARNMFRKGMLPGNTLKIFGEDAITKLHYFMDKDRWEKRFSFEVQWKIYVDGGAPQEGKIPLDTLQFF